MPRAFSPDERATIRAALLTQGRRMFGAYGLRKTSVEELAQAAGISKGAFYLFFGSKEELFFELLEQFEAEFKARLLEQIAQVGTPPRERMRAMLQVAVHSWKQNELFVRFERSEYEQLLRRLPTERVAAHLRGDADYAVVFCEAWAASGTPLTLPPHLVGGLLRALFFVSLHADDFGSQAYPDVIAQMIEMLINHLLPKEVADVDGRES
jgi:AcrR family transcriptional regulator